MNNFVRWHLNPLSLRHCWILQRTHSHSESERSNGPVKQQKESFCSTTCPIYVGIMQSTVPFVSMNARHILRTVFVSIRVGIMLNTVPFMSMDVGIMLSTGPFVSMNVGNILSTIPFASTNVLKQTDHTIDSIGMDSSPTHHSKHH